MRKNIPFLLSVMLLVLQASAQINKNNVYAELTAGPQLFNYNYNSFQPALSVGINRHSTLGVFYLTEKNKFNYPDYSGYTTTRGGGITYSYYHYFNQKTKWGWYLNGRLGIFDNRQYQKQGSLTIGVSRQTEKELTITPGIFFKPSPRILLFANTGGVSLFKTQGMYGIAGSNEFGKQLNVGVQFSILTQKNNRRR